MADINKLAIVINGLVRNQDLSSNTLVVSNLKVSLGGTSHFTFAGTLTANRTIIVPDADVDLGVLLGSSFIRADGSVAFTANQSMGGFRLTNLGAPVSSTDAANKEYVDSVAEGLKPKAAVRVATTANITLSGLQTIDGVSLVAGDRVLVKDQTNAAENGIYVVSAGTWSRADDFDELTPIDEIKGAYVPAIEGTQNQGKLFVCASSPTTLGTDPINFVFFNSVANLIGGDGISISGNVIDVDLDTNSGLEFNAGKLKVDTDNTTVEIGTFGLQVKDLGIDTAKLADNAVTTLKIDDGAVTTIKLADLSVTEGKLDNSSVSTNKLQDNSVTTLKIDDGAVTTIKLADSSVTEGKLDNSSVSTNKLQDNSVTAQKINTSAVDGSTIVGGNGTPLSAVRTFRITLPSSNRIAGESFSTGIWVVRWGKDSLLETAGRLYLADNLESNDKYDAIGFAATNSNLSAGGSFSSSNVVMYGMFNFATAVFTSSDIGKTIYLGSSGAFTLTPPTAPGTAVVELGVVVDVNAIWVKSPVLRGIN